MYSVYATMTIPEHNTLLGVEKCRTYKGVWLLTRESREECEEYVEEILRKDRRFSDIVIERE
jgi:hypothetical protein